MTIPKLPPGFSHPVRIGEGAFASVYRVRQTALDRLVAVKIIPEKNPARRQELLKEARTQASISSDCIPQVYEAFEWKGSVCIVMQWVKGIPLSLLLESQLSQSDRQNLANLFLKSFSNIHSCKLTHGDIKPSNLLVTSGGKIVFVDFGFSSSLSDSVKKIRGTPAFMAPEVWQYGNQIDLFRGDVYSAGKVLQQIVGVGQSCRTVESALENDPGNRPADGELLYAQWLSEFGDSPQNELFTKRYDVCISEYLCVKLLLASKQLFYANRLEEGYWLCVECLEENSENSEALKLLEDFPIRSKMKQFRRSLYALSAAGIVVLIAAVSFLAGKKSARNEMDIATTANQLRIITSRLGVKDTTVKEQLPLRNVLHEPVSTMSAEIVFSNQKCIARVTVDGNDASMDRGRLRVEPGVRNVVAFDSSGMTVWKETAPYFPFQVKKVPVAKGGR